MSRTTRLKALAALVAALVLLLAVVGCSKPAQKPETAEKTETSASAFPVTITDDAGRKVEVKAEPQRIVSLAPGNTEILFELGAGDRVVGVTTYDDFPAEVADIAKVGDFAGPNLEAVAAANPDLVLVTMGVQADVIGKLEKLGATVVAIDPQNIDQLHADIEKIGSITGTSDAAERTVVVMKDAIAEISEKAGDEQSVKAFVEIGQNPLFTVGKGTLIDDLVTLAGGTNVVKQQSYVPYSVEQLVKDDPQAYLATKGSGSDPSSLEKRAGYKNLSAVKNGRVYILDDNLVSRPGPRVVDGVRQIAEALHPDAFKE